MERVRVENMTAEQRRAAVTFLCELEQAGYRAIRLFLPQRLAWGAIRREGFMWALACAELGQHVREDGVWLYPTADAARSALMAWSGEAEPDGWVRHLASRRYRPGGDLRAEHLEP